MRYVDDVRLLGSAEDEVPCGSHRILALGTGMRRGELLNLSWPNVDFLRGLIRVVNTKTAHDRIIPMSQRVREVLIEQRQTQVANNRKATHASGGKYLILLEPAAGIEPGPSNYESAQREKSK